MSTSIMKVTNLKRYFGSVRAVDGVSFEIQRGQSVGLIGANGAGKTTLMRLLTTLDLPDDGEILLDGVDVVSNPEQVCARIGWMPDDFVPLPSTTVRDYVDFFARAYGLAGEKRLNEVQRVVRFCGLQELERRLITKLSKGQRQRLLLARTIIGNPDFLIMDEPAAGLDPKARVEFKHFVRCLQAEGKTLLISSHILSELAEMCDTMILMDAGKILRQGSHASLDASGTEGSQLRWKMQLELLPSAGSLPAFLAARGCWEDVHVLPPPPDSSKKSLPVTAVFVPPTAEADPLRLLSRELRAISAEFELISFRRSQQNLEETFINILSTSHE